MTTTENRMRTSDSDDLIIESTSFRQLFFDKCSSSLVGEGGDEGRGDPSATAGSEGVNVEFIVFMSSLLQQTFVFLKPRILSYWNQLQWFNGESLGPVE